jgi:hypothetical protein
MVEMAKMVEYKGQLVAFEQGEIEIQNRLLKYISPVCYTIYVD